MRILLYMYIYMFVWLGLFSDVPSSSSTNDGVTGVGVMESGEVILLGCRATRVRSDSSVRGITMAGPGNQSFVDAATAAWKYLHMSRESLLRGSSGEGPVPFVSPSAAFMVNISPTAVTKEDGSGKKKEGRKRKRGF